MSESAATAAPRWRLDKRLTPALTARGFTAVPSVFLDRYHELDVTSAEAMVIVHLLSYKWSSRNPFPRLAVLAEKMGLTTTSVRSHLRSLENKGLLKRVSRAGHSNEFDLAPLFAKLEDLLPAEASTTPAAAEES